MDAAHRRLCLRILAPLALAAVGCRTGGLIPDQVRDVMRAQSPDGPTAPAAPVVVPTGPAEPAPAPAALTPGEHA
jgi:hypothetical protein